MCYTFVLHIRFSEKKSQHKWDVRIMYQLKVDVDKLNAVKVVLN